MKRKEFWKRKEYGNGKEEWKRKEEEGYRNTCRALQLQGAKVHISF